MSEPEIGLDTWMFSIKALAPAHVYGRTLWLALVVCRMVNLSLEHGNTDASCQAFVWLGMIAGPLFGNYKAGRSVWPARLRSCRTARAQCDSRRAQTLPFACSSCRGPNICELAMI